MGERTGVRVDYRLEGSELTEVFEGLGDSVLRTTFNREKRVVDRSIVKGYADPGELARELSSRVDASSVSEWNAEEMGRECPKCKGRMELHRERGMVPIMPVYRCGSCGARRIDLTDEYLGRLVEKNRDLFSREELAQLESEPGNFRSELKDYIIKIYASKRIARL